MKKQSFPVRMAKWSAKHPWYSIMGWVLFVVLCMTVGNASGVNKTENEDFWVGEAGRAEAMIAAGQLEPPSVEKILITSPNGELTRHATDAAELLSKKMSVHKAVGKVDIPIGSADGNALMVKVTLKKDYKARDYVQSLRDLTQAVQAEYPDLKIEQTGDASISKGNEEMLGGGLRRAEMITLPITLVILFLVFGRLLAAVVPLILALTSIIASLGLYKVATYVFPDAGGAVTNVVLMIGLAVGVDYSLFFLKRVREERERANGQISHAAAVELAASTSGRAILVSGLAVLVSLLGLYVADDVIFSSIATGSIIVVLIAMMSSLTVLPALLAKLGTKVDNRHYKRKTQPSATAPMLSRMLKVIMNRPTITFLLATLFMAVIAIPVFDLQLKVEGKETFPRSMPAMSAYERMTKAFPDEGVAHVITVRSDSAHFAEVVTALKQMSQGLHHNPLFAVGDTPRIQTSADKTVSILELPIPFGSSSQEATRSLELLRTGIVPEMIGSIASAEYAITGEAARSADTVTHQMGKLPFVALFVLMLSFFILVFAFRSVVIGVIGIVLNILSALATLGAMVMVFQYNWMEMLGLAGGGFVSSRIPLILFVILFGLSMDYQVFVVSRIREAALRGLSTREAVFEGITGSATVVTSAAVVMISVFVSFMFVPYLELKEMGFGLTIAVLLDAIVVRIMILPSIMTLLGKANWWPSRSVERMKSAKVSTM